MRCALVVFVVFCTGCESPTNVRACGQIVVDGKSPIYPLNSDAPIWIPANEVTDSLASGRWRERECQN